MNKIFELKEVSFAYGDRPPVLEEVNWSVEKGARVGLVGANGSGKTTLLKLLMGLVKPDNGRLNILGETREEESDFYEVRTELGLVFQNPDVQLFNPTVQDELAFGLLNQGLTEAEAEPKIEQILEEVGLAGYEDRVPYHLSTGEKQLVALASVLVLEPRMLLLDEPLVSLDPAARQRIIQVIDGEELELIVCTHDPSLVDDLIDSTCRLSEGRINSS